MTFNVDREKEDYALSSMPIFTHRFLFAVATPLDLRDVERRERRIDRN